MELVKNIFFNTDKLIENTNVKVSYTGKLFENNSEEVYIHYGFGINWDNLNEIKMVKTELGFQAEIELTAGDTLNFCFAVYVHTAVKSVSLSGTKYASPTLYVLSPSCHAVIS